MSEHWKSTPKYWCKHCSVYVKDTPFERKQHESTGKHQGNLKRSLTNIQKGHARNEKDKERAKAEVERLNRLTGTTAVLTSDSPQVAGSSAGHNVTKSNTALSAADQKRQWAQLAEMGIAVPESARADIALAGDWQVTTRQNETQTPQDADHKSSVGVHKRKFPGLDEDDLNHRETPVKSAWGTSTKSYPGTIPVADDLAALLARPISKRTKLCPGPAVSGSALEQIPRHDPNDEKGTKVESGDLSVDVKDELKPSDVYYVSGQKDTNTSSRDSEIIAGVKTEGVEDRPDVHIEDPGTSDHLDSVTAAPVFKKRKPKRAPA